MSYSCNLNQVPYCCGMIEVGNFGDASDHDDGDMLDEDSWEELLQEILATSKGRPVLFNFVKFKDWQGSFNKTYDASELRELVQKHPNVMHIWKGINPGSQNRIDSYIIKDYKNG